MFVPKKNRVMKLEQKVVKMLMMILATSASVKLALVVIIVQVGFERRSRLNQADFEIKRNQVDDQTFF